MAGIRHIEFWVADLAKAMKFYGKLMPLLGWNQIDESGFYGDGIKLYLHEEKGITLAKKGSPGPRHICFRVDSRRMVEDVFKFVGKATRGPGVLHPGGSYMVVFEDPDGYILEVAADKNF